MAVRWAARFDDLPDDEALVFGAPTEVVRACRTADVRSALGRVEDAVRDGAWAFGYLAYEAGAGLDDDAPAHDSEPSAMPLVWFGIAEPPRRTRAVARPSGERGYWTAPWTLHSTRPQHAAAVHAIQDAIADGSVYQVNHTGRLGGHIVGDLGELYADLAHAQRSRHNAFLDLGSHAVLSASPELFFDWTPPLVRTRPMKGTAPRATTPDADRRMRDRLTSSTKDVAENVMIVDLIRNDLGRIARTGTVRVPRLLSVEQYPSVWQLTSDVVGEPRADVTLTDVLAALFPSGSVTGAPKLAALRMIDALEPSPRGVYCGAIGWVAPPTEPTRARFSVAIRTVTTDRRTGAATYGAGGGITICSEAPDEFDELVAKTRVLDLATAAATEQPLELIETLALDGGELRHCEHHLARLVASARAFGFVSDEHTIRASLADAVRGHLSARVALRLAADGTVTVRLAALPVPGPDPVRLALDRPSVPPDSIWVRHKTTRRRVYDDARRRHPGVDDVLLVNRRGELTETTIANVAVRLGGTWCTPPLGSGCLPGVGRALALADGRLVERPVAVDELAGCDALALVSSVRGWRPATLVPATERG